MEEQVRLIEERERIRDGGDDTLMVSQISDNATSFQLFCFALYSPFLLFLLEVLF